MKHRRFLVHIKLIRDRLSYYTQVCFSSYLSIPFSHSDFNIVDQCLLVLDLLSVHLVRNINGSTIISYHPTLNIPTTSAKYLHERIRFAGSSTLITIFSFPYPTSRPKRILAKHVPKVAGSYSRFVNIHMARYVFLG